MPEVAAGPEEVAEEERSAPEVEMVPVGWH